MIDNSYVYLNVSQIEQSNNKTKQYNKNQSKIRLKAFIKESPESLIKSIQKNSIGRTASEKLSQKNSTGKSS